MLSLCLNKIIPKIAICSYHVQPRRVSHGIICPYSQYVFIVEMGKGRAEGSSSFCSVYFQDLNHCTGGTVVKNLPANAGDMGSSPGPGRSHMPPSN